MQAVRKRNLTPHIAQNDTNRRSAIDERTNRYDGYAVSERKRKRVEEVFGWIRTVAQQRKTRFRGLERVGWMFTLAASAHNLVRMRNLWRLADRDKVCPETGKGSAGHTAISHTTANSAHFPGFIRSSSDQCVSVT